MATPNHGTQFSYLHPGAGAMQMRPHSDFLRSLNADLRIWNQVRLTNFYTPLDLIIVPYSSSRMPVGTNIRTWALTHPSYIASLTQFRAVNQALNGAPQPGWRRRPQPQR
jgi:triacylglycerol lipase